MGILIDQLFYSEKGITEEKFKCLFFDIGENIHFHYRDLRIELSVNEFKEFIGAIDRYKKDVFSEIEEGYQDGVLPNTNEHHTVKTFWDRERLQHSIKYNPQRITIEENTDGYHIHLRNYKLLMDKESFLELAEGMAQSLFSLKNRNESDPFELLQLNDLFPKLIIKTVTENAEETRVEVQDQYFSKTRQVLHGLGYTTISSDKTKQIFAKENKKIVVFLEHADSLTEHSEETVATGTQMLPLSKFIANVATGMDSATLNILKLKLLYLFKQAEIGNIRPFLLTDIYVNYSDNNPIVNMFCDSSIDPVKEYTKLIDLYTKNNIFMVKPNKTRFNKKYIKYIADKFQKYIDETLSPLPCVGKIYLFGPLSWEEAGEYQTPFVHYDWAKIASDFDILIEIDEDFMDDIPPAWDKKFFYELPSSYYYHLGDLGNIDSLPVTHKYKGVKLYHHLIEAYLFFPSKGDHDTKEEFLRKYKGKLLYRKTDLAAQLRNIYEIDVISTKKFSPKSHNNVYEIITSESKYVYKIYNKKTSMQPGMVNHEVELLNQLRGRDLEISYPVASVSGEYINDVNGSESVLFDYIDGEFTKKVTTSQAQLAGSLVGRFHKNVDKINIDLNEKFSQNYVHELWINNALEFVKQGKMGVYSQEELVDLRDKLPSLKEIETFLHGDVAPKNFKFVGTKCYLIDFEQVTNGLRIFDLIDGMIEFSLERDNCRKEIADVFFEAYNKEFQLSDTQLEHFNNALQIQIMAKITRLYRTHLVFNYDLNRDLIKGLKSCYEKLGNF